MNHNKISYNQDQAYTIYKTNKRLNLFSVLIKLLTNDFCLLMTLSFNTHRRLTDFLVSFAHAELHLENFRKNLAENPDFEPYTAFQKLDQFSLGYLRISDFSTFLSKFGHSVQEKDIEIFFRNYDFNNDMRMNYTDFLEAVLPSTDEVLRQSAARRHTYHLNPTQLGGKAESQLAELLLEEVNVYRTLEATKIELIRCLDWDVHAAFKAIDNTRNGCIEAGVLVEFLEKNSKMTQEEIQPFFRKIDRDLDGKLSYTEFVEIFHPLEKYYKTSEYYRKLSESTRKALFEIGFEEKLTINADKSAIPKDTSSYFTPDASSKYVAYDLAGLISQEKSTRPKNESPAFHSQSPGDDTHPGEDSPLQSKSYTESIQKIYSEQSFSKSVQNLPQKEDSRAALDQTAPRDKTYVPKIPTEKALKRSTRISPKAEDYIHDIVKSSLLHTQQKKQQKDRHGEIYQQGFENLRGNSNGILMAETGTQGNQQRLIQKKLEFDHDTQKAPHEDTNTDDISFRQNHFWAGHESNLNRMHQNAEEPRNRQLASSQNESYVPQNSFESKHFAVSRKLNTSKGSNASQKPVWMPVGPVIKRAPEKLLERSSSPSRVSSHMSANESLHAFAWQNGLSSEASYQRQSQSPDKAQRTSQKSDGTHDLEILKEIDSKRIPTQSKGSRDSFRKDERPYTMRASEEQYFMKVLKDIIELERAFEKAKIDLVRQEDFTPLVAYLEIFSEEGQVLCSRFKFRDVIESYRLNISPVEIGLLFSSFDRDRDDNFSLHDFEALIYPSDPKYVKKLENRKPSQTISSATHHKILEWLKVVAATELGVERIRHRIAKRLLFSFDEAFGALDGGKNGYLLAQDIQNFLGYNGVKVDLFEASWVISQLDLDRDGRVSHEEFQEGLTPKLNLDLRNK